LIACINRETGVGRLAPLSGMLCVNVLARAQRHVAETFAGRTGHVGEERFEVGRWGALASGAPMLAEAIAAFDRRLERCVEFASHVLLVGEVGRTVLGSGEADPLIYVDGAFTTPALQQTWGGQI
jgi:flavin reductase (DIM6/NTAB) family NADH-FMN oxidoreductase RutF